VTFTQLEVVAVAVVAVDVVEIVSSEFQLPL